VSIPADRAPFPVVRPCDLCASAVSTTPWLIDQLWAAQAVIIGGNSQELQDLDGFGNGCGRGFRLRMSDQVHHPIAWTCASVRG
jgi:hypothetical protein